MELARQLTLLSCQNSKEHVDHIVPRTSNMHFLEMLKMKWLVWDTVDVLVDAIGVKLPFVSSPSQYSACSPLLSCGFNLWCKRSSFFHFNVFPPGQRCFQWAVSDSGVSPKVLLPTWNISICSRHSPTIYANATSKNPWFLGIALPCVLLVLSP